MTRLALVLCALTLQAQTPVPVTFSCTQEDMDAAGMSCPETQPCPVYLEVSQVYGRANKLLVTGNLHSDSATLYSILLASDDGGLTWSEPFKRLRSANLDRAQFADDKTGWVAGQTMVPTPRDPFLLLTTDGGKSWRQQALLEEDSPGQLLQFGFENARHGLLVLDRHTEGNRYELYESQAGGTSWTLRSKTMQAPPLPDWNPLPDEWRVRPDHASKTFRVERRQGSQWAAVAALPVQVGACRAAPAAEPAPAPPVTEAAPQPDKDYVEELHLGGAPSKTAKKKKPKS